MTAEIRFSLQPEDLRPFNGDDNAGFMTKPGQLWERLASASLFNVGVTKFYPRNPAKPVTWTVSSPRGEHTFPAADQTNPHANVPYVHTGFECGAL